MNIRDIAKAANVSVATVSRVLNNFPYVSEEKRQTILKIIEETEYVPNSNAIKLSQGKTRIIGVVLPYNLNSSYDRLLQSILQEAAKLSYQVLVLPTYYRPDVEQEYVQLLEQKAIDGLLFTYLPNEAFTQTLQGKERIVFTEYVEETMACVYPNRLSLYRAVCMYLSSKSNQVSILLNRNLIDSPTGKMKKIACEEVGNWSKTTYQTHLTSYQDAFQYGMQLFQAEYKPISIYANGDDIAGGILAAANHCQKKMNQDFYLVGEDALPISELCHFSTVDFHLEEVAKKAVELLLMEPFRATKIEVKGEFIIRGEY